MEEFSEVTHASIIERAMPNFTHKLSKKDLAVQRRYESQSLSQDIIILLDDSGSMRERAKINWVTALFLNRLEENKKGHCNIYISTFEDTVDGFQKLELKEGQTIFDLVAKTASFGRGGTDIEEAVSETIRQIKSGSLIGIDNKPIELNGIKPEILVINDGQDRINPKYHPDIALNTFCLFQHNEELKNISNRSGGQYYRVRD